MTQRNQIIDFIRGFSILSVILLHCYIHLPIEQSLVSVGWVKLLLRSGYYGVMIFFVVSGFLITSISIKRWGDLASINLGEFYKMRFARIMPCLLALLAISSALHLMNIHGFVIHTTTLKQTLFSALTFHINWLRQKTGYLPANLDVLWSLSIEEVFYLFFPLLCIILKNKKHLITILLIFVVLGPFARTVFMTDDEWSEYSYLSCMDGIAIGCIAAMVANYIRSNKVLLSLLTTGLILFSFVFFFRKQAFDIGITSLGLNVTILEIGIAFILLTTQHINVPKYLLRFNGFRLIQWFGRNSYEIYLTHSFIILLAAGVIYYATQPTWLSVIEYVVIVLVSGILGQVIATYYSEPINLKLRTKSLVKTVSYSGASI